MKIKVKYQASFEEEIEVPENPSCSDISDAIADIDIPESETSRYIPDSFSVINYKIGE
jgi:hypothetical protein